MPESNGIDTSASASAPVVVTSDTTQPPLPVPVKSTPPDTPESIAAMKKQAHLKFDEAAKLRKEAQDDKAEAAKLRQEALQSKSQIEQFIELSKTNPAKLKEIYGEDVAKQIAEELLYSIYENEKLTPEQREERARKAADDEELASYRKEKKEREENEAKSQKQALVEEQSTHIDALIAKAIEENNLPKTPRMVKRLAEYLESQLDTVGELDPSGVVIRAHEELHNDVINLIEELPIEKISEEFPTLLERLREFDMKQTAKVPNFQSGFTKPKAEGDTPKKSDQPKTIDEFFKRIG